MKKIQNHLKYVINNGKLIKRIPYVLVRTETKVNSKRLRKIDLKYTLPTGIILTLESEPREDKIFLDKEGYIDLLIDENNLKRYFIDLNINRKSGNKEEDYYKQ